LFDDKLEFTKKNVIKGLLLQGCTDPEFVLEEVITILQRDHKILFGESKPNATFAVEFKALMLYDLIKFERKLFALP